jgi:hypothetical protein
MRLYQSPSFWRRTGRTRTRFGILSELSLSKNLLPQSIYSQSHLLHRRLLQTPAHPCTKGLDRPGRKLQHQMTPVLDPIAGLNGLLTLSPGHYHDISSEWPSLPVPSPGVPMLAGRHEPFSMAWGSSCNKSHGQLALSTGAQSHTAPCYPCSNSQFTPSSPWYNITPEALYPYTTHFHSPQVQAFQPSDPTVSFYNSSDIVPIVFPMVAATTDRLALARYHTFCRGLMLGFRFTSAKTQALLNGDLSHTLVHPALVHVATLWGLVSIAHSQRHPLDDAIPTSHYNAAYASLLVPPTNRSSAVDDVQARVVLALYAYKQENLVGGRERLREAVWIVRRAGLKVILPSRMSGVRDDMSLYIAATAEDQERDAMCSLAYVDTGTRILLNTESHFDEESQQSLTQLLVSIPLIDDMLAIYLQTQLYCDEHLDHASMAVLRLMTITLLFETLSAYRGTGQLSSSRPVLSDDLIRYSS